jgi:hypothetical protein
LRRIAQIVPFVHAATPVRRSDAGAGMACAFKRAAMAASPSSSVTYQA